MMPIIQGGLPAQPGEAGEALQEGGGGAAGGQGEPTLQQVGKTVLQCSRQCSALSSPVQQFSSVFSAGTRWHVTAKTTKGRKTRKKSASIWTLSKSP